MADISKKEIKKIARESVREALQEELALLRAMHLPTVTKKEQRSIETLYKKPSRRVARIVRAHI